ncbi:MAG: hypothetical protein NZ924_04820 [Candidatus Bipolaricaulota bacterium]|nr:hypothetical protein [Candidatus Bipolaricaulota bacterium]MDW8152212.1 hypothetical protein [Candidatus Bipolaricaulota bacterium]
MGGVALLAVLATVLLTGLVGILDDLLDLRQGVKAFLPVPAALPWAAVRARQARLIVPSVGPINPGIFYPLFLVPLGVTGAANAVNMLAGFHGAERGMGGYGHGWARLGGLEGGVCDRLGHPLCRPGCGATQRGSSWETWGTLSVGALLAASRVAGNHEFAGSFSLPPALWIS